jgi:DNA-directed RNA polymerase specialized sigma24 family protein
MNARSEADVRSLETLFKVGTHCGLSDAELLERFLSSTDEAAEFAFEGLVVRHGPMVFDVCLKILGDAHDTQDAFQATFLILATRARSIMKQRSVGSWLHGVALRVARRARSDAARRKHQERRIAEMTSRDVEAKPIRNTATFSSSTRRSNGCRGSIGSRSCYATSKA